MKAGWSQIGKHAGHYFDEGESYSLCKREYRGNDKMELAPDCFGKCSVCKAKAGEPRTPNLFTGENDESK